MVDGFSRIVRLGENLAETGELAPTAMDRTIAALKICAGKINARQVKQVSCIATEACRRASNGAAFVARVERETGLRLQIIPPEREADLTLRGCAPLFNTGHDRAILLDIGGGSTELQWVEVPRRGLPVSRDMISLPIGVVTLAEEYGIGAMDPDVLDQIVTRIDGHLNDFSARNNITEHVAGGRVQMIGTSGTVTTLGALHLGLERYDRSRVDGLAVDVSAIRALSAQLSEMDIADRQKIPCIGAGRADLMLMGCAVLGAVLNCWPVGRLRIADRGIREGLLCEMIHRHISNIAQNATPQGSMPPLSVTPAV